MTVPRVCPFCPSPSPPPDGTFYVECRCGAFQGADEGVRWTFGPDKDSEEWIELHDGECVMRSRSGPLRREGRPLSPREAEEFIRGVIVESVLKC